MGNKMKPRNSLGGGGCSVPLPGGVRGPGLPAPLTAALSLPLQKKKGKEAGSGAALPAPRVPALPPEARAPHSSSPAAAKRSKAKAKGKEVKKEVRLAVPSGPVPPAPHGPPGVGGRWGGPGCAPLSPFPRQVHCVAGGAVSAHFALRRPWEVSPAGAPVPAEQTTVASREGPSRTRLGRHVLSRGSVLLCPQNRGKGGAVSKLMESMAAEEDFEPNQDSSFSEDEHLPPGGAAERPLTPGECPPCRAGSGESPGLLSPWGSYGGRAPMGGNGGM